MDIYILHTDAWGMESAHSSLEGAREAKIALMGYAAYRLAEERQDEPKRLKITRLTLDEPDSILPL